MYETSKKEWLFLQIVPDELLSMARRYEAHKQKMQEERANGTYRPRGGGRGRRREEGVYLCMDGVPWCQSQGS